MAIKYFNLSPKNDGLLIAKLNVVSDVVRRKPHDLGKLILEDGLNKIAAENNIDLSRIQLADAG